jgi:hypothetical protein
MACIIWRRQARRHRDATMVMSARVLLGDVEHGLSCHETSGVPRNYHWWTILTGFAALLTNLLRPWNARMIYSERGEMLLQEGIGW